MELIIQILILFIVINYVVKLSFWRLWQVAIFSVIIAIFILFTCRYAIEQSKTQLADYLDNSKVMQDMAVLITVESVVCFAFCISALRGLFSKKKKRRFRFLRWYPGLLIFPALFYILTQTIFGMTGVDFTTISYILGGACLIGFPLVTMGVKYLLPEKGLRLEVHFLLSLFVCIIGLITTVDGSVTYAAAAQTTTDSKVVILSFALFASMFFAGYLWSRVKWRFFRKTEQNKKLK